MKRKSLIEKFDHAMWFNVFIYSMGIFFGARIIKEVLLIFLPEVSKIISSLIFLVLYIGLLFMSNELLTKTKFKTFTKYVSFGLLAIYLIKFILTYVFDSKLFI